MPTYLAAGVFRKRGISKSTGIPHDQSHHIIDAASAAAVTSATVASAAVSAS